MAPEISTGPQKQTISATVIFKKFVLKNGASTKRKEAYIRYSGLDYFVKFCKSKISRKDLEKHISKIDQASKVATFEVEFHNGLLDICDGNFQQQSRKGAYVIIHRIAKN